MARKVAGAALHPVVRADDTLALDSRAVKWTRAVEDRFFATLAQTANVSMSLRAVEISAASAYLRRRRYPHFAVAWDSALADAASRIESDMLARALVAGTDPDKAGDVEPMDDRMRLQLVTQHRARIEKHRAGAGPAALADAKRLRAELIARLDRLADALEKEGDA